MSGEEIPFPRLAPELCRLSGDALQVWGDARTRRLALEDILAAWRYEQPDRLRAAIERVDAAVREGLVQLGLPRGPVREVQVRWRPGGQHAAKLPSSVLVLSGNYVQAMLELHHHPDSVVRTWIHESLHARQPFTGAQYAAEAQQVLGYEEGLVEGLARVVAQDKAGMVTLDLAYDGYVRAYRALARGLGIGVEQVWRDLWQAGLGQVRAAFPGVIAALRGGQAHLEKAHELLEVADQLFATSRQDADVADSQLERIWRSVLP